MKKIIILNLLIFTIISFVSLNLVNSKEVRFYGSEDNVSVLSNNSIYENAINKNTTLFKYFYNLTNLNFLNSTTLLVDHLYFLIFLDNTYYSYLFL